MSNSHAIPVPEPVREGRIIRCPECPRVAVVYQQYAAHYRSMHGEAREHYRECLECGEIFHDDYHPDKKYCSPSCRGRGLRRLQG